MNVYVEKLKPLNTGIHSDERPVKKDGSLCCLYEPKCDVYVIKFDKDTGKYSGKPTCDPLAPVEW